MHNIENRFAVLENAARHVYIRSRNKMVALRYVYTLGKQTVPIGIPPALSS